MPFIFSTFTSLLQKLEKVRTRDPPHLPAEETKRLKQETQNWFRIHRRSIDELGIDGAVALLSSLLPERRTDRVYGIQAKRLSLLLGRALHLGTESRNNLLACNQPGKGDLAECLARVVPTPPALPVVTLEEVDEMLSRLAGQCRFSDRAVKAQLPPGSSEERDKLIGDVCKRLNPEEAKWFVRLMLKDFAPVQVHEGLVLQLFHFLLPDLLRFQNNIETTVCLLKEDPELSKLPTQPDPHSAKIHKLNAASYIRPVVGVKVGRPDFSKARSIDHCTQLVGQKKWVLERKYDGEYCEIHIDIPEDRTNTHPRHWIKIFSKSGKDSTEDRKGVHQTLIECLRLGKTDCKIKKQAILLGELVVYSDETRAVVSFDKVRKYVSRSGVFLGTEQDSQNHAHEHLAIVFFDILLLDHEIVMSKPVEERRDWLREVYRKTRGRAMSTEWKPVDFSEPLVASERLKEQFAASIAQRCEGLILKPCGVPYFCLDKDPGGPWRGFIKLKKDYMQGMGDEADFAVIGASYNAQQAQRSRLKNIKYTDFHLGCLINAEDVERYAKTPKFQLVATIQAKACIPEPILQTLNLVPEWQTVSHVPGDKDALFEVHSSVPVNIGKLFKDPPVLEVLGSGFNKPANCNFWMLRHPRAKKLHEDRSWKECISLEALQEQAKAANEAPVDNDDLAETNRWIEKLEKKEKKLKRRLEREGTLTPSSRRTTTPNTAKTTDISARLNGSTPFGSGRVSPKRTAEKAERTPCPEPKRRRSENSPSDTRVQRTANPLQEITNQVYARDNAARAAQDVIVIEDSPDPYRSTKCAGTRCPFSNSAVYLAPCIEKYLYVTETLLPRHNAMCVSSLSHWDRDSFAHPPITDTVSESQAYPGMRKVVLVESKRQAVMEELVARIRALNNGSFRERVEVYDWRVLELCQKHDKSADALKQHFVGATIFDEGRQRAIFVS